MPDRKGVKRSNRITFDYPPVDMTSFRKDPRRREIPPILLQRIGKGARALEKQIRRIEENATIRYPPTVVLPSAIYEVDNRMIIDADVTLTQKDKNIFFQVRFSAPTVAFADEKKLLGIAAHEFLHYVKHTIRTGQYKAEHGTLEGVSIGEVPPEIKAKGVKARDEYHTVDAEDWISCDVLAAWQLIEEETFTVSTWAALITREWIGKGYPTEDFRRGSVIRPDAPGRFIYDPIIIDKAKKLGLMA